MSFYGQADRKGWPKRESITAKFHGNKHFLPNLDYTTALIPFVRGF